MRRVCSPVGGGARRWTRPLEPALSAHVVVELNVSRATDYKWLARWRAEGPAGLHDRSSRAHRLPSKASTALEAELLALRSSRKLGPARPVHWSVCRPRRCTRCSACTSRTGWPGWTARPGNWSAAMSAPDPASWCTSTSESSAPFDQAAAGGCTVRTPRRSTTHAPRTAPGAASAMTTCTAQSTTTPDWPTPRSTPTKPRSPAPFSGAAAVWFAGQGIGRIGRPCPTGYTPTTITAATPRSADTPDQPDGRQQRSWTRHLVGR